MFERLAKRFFRGAGFMARLPNGRLVAVGEATPEDSPVVVAIADRVTLMRLLRDPRLGLGEAHMEGTLVFERGTLWDLMELIGRNVALRPRRKPSLMSELARRWRNSLDQANPRAAAQRNVAHHYDLSLELYRLFLDEDLQYSCAYFPTADMTLEEAQKAKKRHIMAKLLLEPGQSVLDIGCGWGGMALSLAEAGVQATGVTLSEQQLATARERAVKRGLSNSTRFELKDYRDLEGPYDRIVSIGMFEHVGAAHYDEFFAACRNLLAEDGVMLLHTIGKYGKASAPDPFTDKWIFPGYHLPSISQLSAASERQRLITSDLELLRVHYAYTLRHWLERARANRDKIVALHDERFFRMWEFYLSGGVVAFESGSMCNFQAQYIRDRNALPITRDYMAEAEGRYRAS